MLKKCIFILLLGAINGSTFSFLFTTINFCLAKHGVSKVNIGLFTSAISLPYAINFLWMPFLEKIKICSNQYKNKLILLIIFLLFSSVFVFCISNCFSKVSFQYILICGAILAFLSASKDSIIGGIRAEVLLPIEHGTTAGFYTLGYRVGMLLVGPCTILLSVYIKWKSIYELFSLFIVTLGFFLFKFFDITYQIKPSSNKLSVNFIKSIFQSLGGFKIFVLIMMLLFAYRISDSLIAHMINVFLLDIGFKEKEIALAKSLSIFGAIIGGPIASFCLCKLSIFQGLKYFSIIHVLTYLFFIVQYYCHNFVFLIFTTIITSITSGMMFTTYIAFITFLCSGQYMSTQYSMFTSMMGLSRVICSVFSGIILYYTNWIVFFTLGILGIIPSLILLKYLQRYKKT